MMPAIYVLDVKEFQPIVDSARAAAGVTVAGPKAGYFRISSDTELVFNRKTLGFKPAVWYGALTGGLVGRIAEFSRDTLRVVGD
jgi:hypothetical protein